MNININGTDTAINEVNFDGNSDITKVNVDGVDVWFKAPTALEVTEALANDAPSSSGGMSNSYTLDNKFLRYHGQQQDNTSTLSLTDDISTSGLSAPITTSPYVTILGITCGTDQGGGALYDQYYTPSGGSETGATENTAITYNAGAQNSWMSIRTSYVNKSMTDLSGYRITYRGAGNDLPILRTQMILPNKWNATTVSSDGAGSYSLGSGEILVICNLYGWYDAYLAGNYVGNTVTPGSNSILLENEQYWYRNNSIGIYANATSSSQTISWLDNGQNYVRVMKLTQQGI